MDGTLDTTKVRSLLTTARWGHALTWASDTGSTNDDAKEAAVNGAVDGHVFGADAQRAGRGSHGRVWSSPPGEDLYFSVVCRTGLSVASLPPVTLAVGLGVAEAVAVYAGDVPTHIKWPNDVMLGGAKCAGILVESFSHDQSQVAIIGIGVNVNRVDFEPGIASLSTSLAHRTGQPLVREAVLASVLEAVESRVDAFARFGPRTFVTELNRRLWLADEPVTIDGSTRGVLRRVEEDGSLLVEVDGRARSVRSGRIERAAAVLP